MGISNPLGNVANWHLIPIHQEDVMKYLMAILYHMVLFFAIPYKIKHIANKIKVIPLSSRCLKKSTQEVPE